MKDDVESNEGVHSDNNFVLLDIITIIIKN